LGDGVKTGMDEGDWDVLLARIRGQKCTPFLGAGASAHVLPTGSSLAARWAEELGYPLPDRSDLARVAQYWAIMTDPLVPKDRVSEVCLAVDPAGALQPGDTYDILSGLDLPLYVTTNYDDLLLHALRNKDKDPQVLLCPWHKALHPAVSKTYMGKPTVESPLVYYLHGSAHTPSSIVLTEDDYLAFIVWVTRQWEKKAQVSLISAAVTLAFGETSLLFIGYSQNDWTFRVLMRCIKETGASLGARGVAVQLDPLGEDATEVDREKVARYLIKYFGGIQDRPVSIYWGTADEFLQELTSRRNAAKAA